MVILPVSCPLYTLQICTQVRAALLRLPSETSRLWSSVLAECLEAQIAPPHAVLRPVLWDAGPPELLGFLAAHERVLRDRVRATPALCVICLQMVTVIFNQLGSLVGEAVWVAQHPFRHSCRHGRACARDVRHRVACLATFTAACPVSP